MATVDPKAALIARPSTVSFPFPPKRKRRTKKLFRAAVVSIFRSFQVLTFHFKCGGLPPPPVGCMSDARRVHVPCDRLTCTFFGYRRGRLNLCMQESPKCHPSHIIELAIQTHFLFRELSTGVVRMALECPLTHHHAPPLLNEPTWSVFCNGRKSGSGVRRDVTDDDLDVMTLLCAVSMGVGVLPGRSNLEGPDGEIAYIRGGFDHVVGSKDSESLYLVSPQTGTTGPDLTIFFVRM